MSSTDLAATVGRNIRTARKAAGLTQGELARKVGVTSLMAISRWERGEHRPSDDSLVQLSLALKKDFAWFFTEHELERAA